MSQTKVLFLCVHNSARSQMAAAFLKKFGGESFFVESAGLEAGKINPLAIAVMREEGIDISENATNDVFDYFRQGRSYEYVITVCDKEASDRCPHFPGLHQKINWSFPDPSKFAGSQEDKLSQTRAVRDQIKTAVLDFVRQLAQTEKK
jgi:arsenate reductase